MCTNDAARPGWSLVLTKPIGTGIIATAIKAGNADAPTIEAATRSMATLNRGSGEAMTAIGVRAATDVTGFGLLGHLRQMLRSSGVSARIDSAAVPLLPGAYELAQTARFPGGTLRNMEDLKGDVLFPEDMPLAGRLLLADAQTSGGLLMAVPPELLPQLQARLVDAAPAAAVIGKTEEGPPGRIQIT
jgi:selenide,water dikinase